MEYNEVTSAGRQLFARINTVKANDGQGEKLDANEIAQAKAFGFSMFNLTKDMTEAEFVNMYNQIELKDEQEEIAFKQQERNIHARYINHKYGTELELKEDESIENFEARAKDMASNKAAGKSFGISSENINEQHAKEMEESWKEYEVHTELPDSIEQHIQEYREFKKAAMEDLKKQREEQIKDLEKTHQEIIDNLDKLEQEYNLQKIKNELNNLTTK